MYTRICNTVLLARIKWGKIVFCILDQVYKPSVENMVLYPYSLEISSITNGVGR